MKRRYFIFAITVMMAAMLQGCGAGGETADPKAGVTEEMAYEGVYNYCHSVYDWSIAEDDPDIMYLEMGEETESDYRVIFRSYTGAFVYFDVDKTSGMTQLTEYVPLLELEEALGTIDLYDWLEPEDR